MCWLLAGRSTQKFKGIKRQSHLLKKVGKQNMAKCQIFLFCSAFSLKVRGPCDICHTFILKASLVPYDEKLYYLSVSWKNDQDLFLWLLITMNR